MSLHPSSLLRRALFADAVVSGVAGFVMLAGADLFADLMALPAGLVRYAGLILLPFALWVGWLSRQEQISRAAVAGVLAINLVWGVESMAILAFGWIAPNALGTGFVVAQALIVAGFGAVQVAGMRRSTNTLATV